MARYRSFWMLPSHPIRQSSNYATHPLHSAICCPSHWCLYNLCLVDSIALGAERHRQQASLLRLMLIRLTHCPSSATIMTVFVQMWKIYLKSKGNDCYICEWKHSGSNQKFLNILFKTSFCSSAPIKYVENYKIWYLLHMFAVRKSLITYADTSRWITCASYRPIYKLNTDIRYNGPILGATALKPFSFFTQRKSALQFCRTLNPNRGLFNNKGFGLLKTRRMSAGDKWRKDAFRILASQIKWLWSEDRSSI